MDADEWPWRRLGAWPKLPIPLLWAIRYRNFFKAVIELQTAPSSKIDLKTFLRCLAAIGMDMDNDEVECVLANLIYAGYIKGYISHQHGKLVVSKGNAFPELSAVQGGK